ncbi:unnamed protein product [Trifolium pratense]|uniref:Uncharacterized protein n=1 Tax=Trifolium pratense TaxID=57577 RepID=A0ACB0INC5_TRIPR|nr:unnamed protein product [Trifolium pratense]
MTNYILEERIVLFDIDQISNFTQREEFDEEKEPDGMVLSGCSQPVSAAEMKSREEFDEEK